MNISFLDVLIILGSLGFFIFGMKVMSEGLQKVAGSRLRKILGSMTRNRFLGVFTGFIITCLIQSSSATTVMVVSFANAGLLTLIESIGVIMGANIGTTITGWLISLLGFKVNIEAFALPLIAFGFPMMFTKSSRLKSIAEVLIGFALLFMGLESLKDSVPNLNENPEVLDFLATFTSYGILSTILFVGVGTIITVIIQSSSAAMALTLTLLFTDVITLEVAAAMVLGENIGTTITANLAAIVANVHAKRAARAHFIFNTVGVIWLILMFPLFLELIKSIWQPVQVMLAPLTDFASNQEELQLSLFHTVFNLLNTILMIGFVPAIARLVTKMVPSKGDGDDAHQLEYIGTGMMLTTEASILEAKKEVANFGRLVQKMTGFVSPLLVETDMRAFEKSIKRIKKYEEITDRIQLEISDYLAKVSEGEMNESASIRIRSMLSIVSDLEEIGDINFKMSKTINRKSENRIWFTPKQRQNLLTMFELLNQTLEQMNLNLNGEFEHANLEEAKNLEKQLNKMRNSLRKEHLKNVEKGTYKFDSGMIYNDLFSSIEKIGDLVYSVNQAIAGEI